MEQAIKEEALDLWICHHFRILPTNGDFKRLSEAQKIMLFQSYLQQPSSEEVRLSYLSSQKKKSGKVVQQINSLSSIGYNKEQINRIKDQLEKAGLL